MIMHEGIKDFYHRQRVCCRCGKIFRIPPIGQYPYRIKQHGHSMYFCSESCKRKYLEEAGKMKGWRRGTYFRNARPCTGGTLNELREIRQDFKRFKKLLSGARGWNLRWIGKKYRFVMRKKAWTMCVEGKEKTS